MEEEKILEDLETELSCLGQEFKEATFASSLIPSILRTLENRERKVSLWLKGTPAFLTLVLFVSLIRFFSFSAEPLLNLVKIVFFVFSSVIGGFFIFTPEKMSRIDKRFARRLLRQGTAASSLEENLLFRFQGLYFILIAFLICKM